LVQGGLQQQQSLVVADTYRSSRAEALHQVEATIVELGSIFTQLAEMVRRQGGRQLNGEGDEGGGSTGLHCSWGGRGRTQSGLQALWCLLASLPACCAKTAVHALQEGCHTWLLAA
jgi:hypothetical protein